MRMLRCTCRGAGEMRLADALGKHYEIARPGPDALAFIAARSSNGALRDLLMPERKADLKQWLWGQQLADVLHEFPVEPQRRRIDRHAQAFATASLFDRVEPEGASRRSASDGFRRALQQRPPAS